MSRVEARLKARARLLRHTRRFFDEQGFVEVQTPAIVPSPGMDVHLDAFEVRDGRGRREGWLATSPEFQMKRLLCEGAERIYQIAPAYRDDEHGRLHEREFTMLEWYRTVDACRPGDAEVMADTEALVERLAREMTGATLLETAFGTVDVAAPWPRTTVEEAFQVHAGADAHALAMQDEDAFFLCMAERVQPKLGNERPVFLTDWPPAMASLAVLRPSGLAARFEAFICGIELCNGFAELTDPAEQRRRFEVDQAARRDLGKVAYPIDEAFLSALERGMPDSGGNALGVDRLLMLLTGSERVQDVIAFPQDAL